MSKSKPSRSEDPFATIPPRETFDAFPSLAAFPEDSIAFLTGKAAGATPRQEAQEIPPAQPDAKPVARPVSKPVSRPAEQPASQPVSQPETPSASQTKSRPAAPSATPKASPKASPSASQSKDLTASQSQGHTADQLASPTQSLSQDQLLDQTASPSPGRTMSRPLGRAKVADRLNDNQRRVLDLLLAAKPYIIKFRDIADALDMREASVRTVMRRLDALDFLRFRKARDGNLQGVGVTFNQPVIEQYQQDLSLDQSASLASDQPQSHTQSLTQNLSQSHAQGLTPSPTRSLSPSQPFSEPVSQSANPSPPLKIEKIEHLSIQAWEGWDDAFVELMWPRVFAAGLRREQLDQALAARAKLGKPLERDLTALSLDRAEWELETRGKLVDLQTGEPVRSVAAYIFTALARWGVLRAHPEYVSREETEAQAAVAALRRRKEALETLENVRFEQYRDGLTAPELESILQGFPGGSKDAWIKAHWRKNVRDAS